MTVLAENPLPLVVGATYVIDVKLDGAEIKVAVDDTLVLDVEDASLAAGTVGLYTKGSELVIFGDVTVNGVATDIPVIDDDDVPDDVVVPDDDPADDVEGDLLETGGGGGGGGCFVSSAI